MVRAEAGKIWPHRLSSGFPSDVLIAAKTGTVPAVRNEAGVVTYPDGRRYAVAVFTRADSLADRLPDVDSSIGAAGHRVVEHLRALSSQPHPHTSHLACGSHRCPAAERLLLLPPLSAWATRPPRA
ncbi:serine hydrolase [Arthrobacter sp. 35W]|uniref:serine hydrolase n=1 Tax=Arthrobacter sp. 35W TaxID=1132441 RepID=UPI002F2B59CF